MSAKKRTQPVPNSSAGSAILSVSDPRVKALEAYVVDLIATKEFRRNEAWKRIEQYNTGSAQPLDKANLDFHFKRAAKLAEKKLDEDKRRRRQTSSSSALSPDPAHFADDALAREFSTLHAGDLKYTAAQSQWYVWTGIYWKPDKQLKVWDKAREFTEDKAKKVLTDFPNSAGSIEAANLRSKAKIYSIEALARSDERHAASSSLWNPDPMILATPSGVVDLRTGQLRAARPEDFATQLTRVGPAVGGAEHPIWSQFLDEVTGGDRQLQAYLQRVFGYLLTAEIRDHAMFFLFGPGGNGKGTFVDTLQEIMGDYATGVPVSALMKSNRDRHSTEIFKLLGHRLAVASETESGREWDESRIKYLTGGDPITARPMRQDFITFPPTHKLFVVGNNQPKLGNVDDAARRRFHMIPFTTKIPQPDKLLREKLRHEYPAILRWGIAGTLAWQHEGLNPPSVVLASTQEYFDDQDVVGRWVDEQCELLPTAETLNKDLYQNFVVWTQKNGDGDALPGKDTFLTQLRRLPGVTRITIGRAGRGLKGLRIRIPEPVRDEDLLGQASEARSAAEVSTEAQTFVVSKRVN